MNYQTIPATDKVLLGAEMPTDDGGHIEVSVRSYGGAPPVLLIQRYSPQGEWRGLGRLTGTEAQALTELLSENRRFIAAAMKKGGAAR